MFTSRKKAEEQADLHEKVRSSHEKTSVLQADIKAQNQQIQKQQALLEKLAERQVKAVQQFEAEVQSLHDLNTQVSAGVHNLNTAKIELKEQVTTQFQQQLMKATGEMESRLAADLSKVEELSGKLGAFTQQLKASSTIIHQFQDLAATIKDADFQLKEHAKSLEKADQEKVKLLRRIDELESMMAKFKRGTQRPRRF